MITIKKIINESDRCGCCLELDYEFYLIYFQDDSGKIMNSIKLCEECYCDLAANFVAITK